MIHAHIVKNECVLINFFFFLSQLDRLTALMKQVDYECGVIPKGALIFDAKKNLVKNVYFPGRSLLLIM